MDTEIFLSGNLASYIQTGTDKILVGKALYVTKNNSPHYLRDLFTKNGF